MYKLYIGTSGYNYSHWKGVFYPPSLPQRKWLYFYSRRFNSLEINATFYRHFPRSVFEKWYSETGKDFAFVLKGPRLITHVNRLKNPQKYLTRFLSTSSVLEEKLNCLLWQFPPQFKYSEDNLNRLEFFINKLPQKLKSAMEFRHNSWFNDNLFSLLQKKNTGFVINDSARFPKYEYVAGNFVYIRFHGPTSLYSSNYSQVLLNLWADKINTYLKSYDVYCFFNNDFGGFALKNAAFLKEEVLPAQKNKLFACNSQLFIF